MGAFENETARNVLYFQNLHHETVTRLVSNLHIGRQSTFRRTISACLGVFLVLTACICVVPDMALGQEDSRSSLKPSLSSSSPSSVRNAGYAQGNTYVSLASGLERVFAGREPGSLAELKLMELQQSKVAEAIEKVTVNVQQGNAQGSGVIITEDGYVLTAAHVAGKPNLEATIKFSDGRTVRAKTLGMNRDTDAGLLKIIDKQLEPWPYATLGRVQSDSNPEKSLREGQWCVTAGFPGGFKEHRGAAIRVGRILRIQKDRQTNKAHTLFTDCALIGGDSGGPLFTLDGTLVGIHSRIGVEVSENMHVPIDVFADSWNRMVQAEAWGVLPGLRPVIGVQGAQNEERPIIARVESGGPAARAGIAAGDLIVSFDGEDLETFADLKRAVLNTVPGEVVKIRVQREGQLLNIFLTIGAEN